MSFLWACACVCSLDSQSPAGLRVDLQVLQSWCISAEVQLQVCMHWNLAMIGSKKGSNNPKRNSDNDRVLKLFRR